jgi:hypothetical protein
METGIEMIKFKDLVLHRVKDYASIKKAIEIQDRIRESSGKNEGEDSTKIIRKWREAR